MIRNFTIWLVSPDYTESTALGLRGLTVPGFFAPDCTVFATVAFVAVEAALAAGVFFMSAPVPVFLLPVPALVALAVLRTLGEAATFLGLYWQVS